MKIIDKYIEIVDMDGDTKTIHNYIDHYIHEEWFVVKYKTESGGNGVYSKALSHIESYDLHVATINKVLMKHINIDAVIKKDDKMKQDKIEALELIAFKLEEMFGYKLEIESKYSEIYELAKSIGMGDEIERDLDNCDNADDYNEMSCNISNMIEY